MSENSLRGWAYVPTDIRDSYIKELGGKNNVIWTFDSTRNNSEIFYPFPETLEDFLAGDNVVKETYTNFIKYIPKVQVRAYVPETILNEVFNLMSPAFQAGYDLAKNSSDPLGAIAEYLGEKFDEYQILMATLQTDSGRENFINTLANGLSFAKDMGLDGSKLNGIKYKNQVITLPYILYYKLLGAKTNNIYEFPAYINEGFLNSDGSYGWPQQNDFSAFDSFGRNNKLINFVLKNLNVSYMPFFNPQKDSGKNYAEISCFFNLVNDTKKKALANYSMIHSLHMNNLWVQSGLIQGPSSLYDVKLLGGQRLFMCTASINITYSGAFRTLDKADIGTSKFDMDINKQQGGIRIPEAYGVSITFKSLLPNNFNNFIMAKFSSAANELFQVKPGDKVESWEDKFFENLGDAIKNASTSDIEKSTYKEAQAEVEKIKEQTDATSFQLRSLQSDIFHTKLDARRKWIDENMEEYKKLYPNYTYEQIVEKMKEADGYIGAGEPDIAVKRNNFCADHPKKVSNEITESNEEGGGE